MHNIIKKLIKIAEVLDKANCPVQSDEVTDVLVKVAQYDSNNAAQNKLREQDAAKLNAAQPVVNPQQTAATQQLINNNTSLLQGLYNGYKPVAQPVQSYGPPTPNRDISTLRSVGDQENYDAMVNQNNQNYYEDGKVIGGKFHAPNKQDPQWWIDHAIHQLDPLVETMIKQKATPKEIRDAMEMNLAANPNHTQEFANAYLNRLDGYLKELYPNEIPDTETKPVQTNSTPLQTNVPESQLQPTVNQQTGGQQQRAQAPRLTANSPVWQNLNVYTMPKNMRLPQFPSEIVDPKTGTVRLYSNGTFQTPEIAQYVKNWYESIPAANAARKNAAKNWLVSQNVNLQSLGIA